MLLQLLASLQLSLPLPSLSSHVLAQMWDLPHSYNSIVFKIRMQRKVLLVQQVCTCAHLGVDELLNVWSIPTASLPVSNSPLDCLYNQTHDLELLRDIKKL